MKTFAQALYYGDLIPWGRGRPQDPEYTPMKHRISDIKIHLQRVLPAGEWELFEELDNLYARSSTIEDIDAFTYGLNMGVLLMMGAMEFKSEHMERKCEDDGF